MTMKQTGAVSAEESESQIAAIERVYAGKSEMPRTTSAPKVIYLQYSAHENDYLKDYSDGITWCAGKANSDDVEYILADIHEAIEKEAVRLRECLQEVVDADQANNPGVNRCNCRQCNSIRAARALLSPAPTERADK